VNFAARIAAAGCFLAVGQAQSILGTNLIVNGDAESGTASASVSKLVASIPGWTRSGNVNVLSYGITNYLLTTSPSPPDRGFQYFAGAGYPAPLTLTQTIDVSSAQSTISGGSVKFTASAYLGGSNPSDYYGNAAMAVAFQNAGGQTFSTVTLGPLAYIGNGLTLQQQIGLVPTGTSKILITVSLGGINGGNGAADSLSLVLTTLGTSPGTVLGQNLVVNGDAESGPAAVAPAIAQYIPGWSTTDAISVAPYGGASWITTSDPGPVNPGVNVFWGTSTSSSMYQDLDVSPAASLIDAGQVNYDVSAWLGATYPTAASPTLTYTFYDWTGKQLAPTAQLGPVARSGGISMFEVASTGLLPANTRRVRITLTFGVNYRYIADNIAFVLAAPSGPPVVDAAGVESASGFGGFSTIAPGSWVEIYGYNLASTTRSWGAADFNSANAPTSLSGTTVTIGGQSAFIDYISPSQINVQIPSTLSPGPQALTVTTATGTSGPYAIEVNAIQPGLLAPSSFQVGAIQYVVALLTDGVTYILPPGAIPGVASQRAKAGQTIILYGVGFGSVTPNIPAGEVVGQSNALVDSFVMKIGNQLATVQYAGLAPGFVGLYQFNVVVPNVASSDKVAVTFSLGSVAGTQTLYLAVGN
jgi:uncharacterized protein (TIGR03437 family)